MGKLKCKRERMYIYSWLIQLKWKIEFNLTKAFDVVYNIAVITKGFAVAVVICTNGDKKLLHLVKELNKKVMHCWTFGKHSRIL